MVPKLIQWVVLVLEKAFIRSVLEIQYTSQSPQGIQGTGMVNRKKA
jgi:hypothetical protein